MAKTSSKVVKTRSDVVKISSDVVFPTSDVVKILLIFDEKTTHIPFTMKKIAEKQKKYFQRINFPIFMSPKTPVFR